MTETPQHDIKMVVVDLDGTLLNEQHQMSERNASALEAIIQKEIPLILATGKTRASAEAIIERLNLKSPGIFVQGLIVHNGDGTVRHQQTLDASIVRRIITFAEDRGYDANLYSGTRILIRPSFDPAKITEYGEPEPEVTGPFVNLLNELSVNKLALYGTERKIRALRWQLEAQFGDEVTITRAHVPGMIEVLPIGANKGKALFALAKEMQIKPAQILAIGDGENDTDMVNMAGIGVAMANAHENVKAVAQHITASNNEDGVAQALEKYFPDIAPPKPNPEITATEVMPAADISKRVENAEADSPPATETTTEEKAE